MNAVVPPDSTMRNLESHHTSTNVRKANALLQKGLTVTVNKKVFPRLLPITSRSSIFHVITPPIPTRAPTRGPSDARTTEMPDWWIDSRRASVPHQRTDALEFACADLGVAVASRSPAPIVPILLDARAWVSCYTP